MNIKLKTDKRNYREGLSDGQGTSPDHLAGTDMKKCEWNKFEETCRRAGVKLRNWRFNRDAANKR